jgi:hypothetical protein
MAILISAEDSAGIRGMATSLSEVVALKGGETGSYSREEPPRHLRESSGAR